MSETTTPPGYQRCPSCDTLNNSRRLQCVKCGAELPNLDPVGAPTSGPDVVEVTEIAASPPGESASGEQFPQVKPRNKDDLTPMQIAMWLGGFALLTWCFFSCSTARPWRESRYTELTEQCANDKSENGTKACYKACEYAPLGEIKRCHETARNQHWLNGR
jgi:hypothetical protein